MRTFFYTLFLCIAVNCTKPYPSTDCRADLQFTLTNTPGSTTLANGIHPYIECYGPNLCYQFSGYDIQPSQGNNIYIRAVATIPCQAVACAQALYQLKDTLNIAVQTRGTFYLHFHHSGQIFKTDTVQVN